MDGHARWTLSVGDKGVAMTKSIAQTLAEQISESAPSPEVITTPAANAPVPHPCLTREMLMSRGQTSFSMTVFDALGCKVHPASGCRIPEDGGSSNQKLVCFNPKLSTYKDEHMSLTDFLAVAIPVVMRLIPVTGSSLAGVIGHVLGPSIVELSEYIVQSVANSLGKAFGGILDIVEEWVSEVYSGSSTFLENPNITHQTLVSTAKAVANAYGMVGDVGTRIVSYQGVREGLTWARDMLERSEPSLAMLDRFGLGAWSSIDSLASYTTAIDSWKSLAITQSSLDFARDKLGSGPTFPSDLDNFIVAQMPDLKKGVDIEGMQRRLRENVGVDVGVEAALHFAASYAGEPDLMLGALDPKKLSMMIPNTIDRAHFERELTKLVSFERRIAPVVKEAGQDYFRVQTSVGRYLTDLSGPISEELKNLPKDTDIAALVRTKLDIALNDANAKVRDIIRRSQTIIEPIFGSTKKDIDSTVSEFRSRTDSVSVGFIERLEHLASIGDKKAAEMVASYHRGRKKGKRP